MKSFWTSSPKSPEIRALKFGNLLAVLGALKAEGGLQVALSGTAHAGHAGHAAHACHRKVMACNDSSDDESCWAKTGDRKFSNYEAMKLHHRHKGDIKYLHASLLVHEMVYTVYL